MRIHPVLLGLVGVGCGGVALEAPERRPLRALEEPPPVQVIPAPALPDFEAARPMPTVPTTVEAADDRGAWLIPLDGGRGVMVFRWQLPPEAKDGDVIVEGKVDVALTRRHHAELAEELRRLAAASRASAGGR